jgi:hypothetical protein
MNGVLTIDDAPAPGEGGNLTEGMVGDPYFTKLDASGGSGSYHWTLDATSALPSGLVLDGNSGVISGVPDRLAEGTSAVSVLANDGTTTVTRTFSLKINSGLRISRDTDLEGPDSIRLKADGGFGTPTWQPVGSGLPNWLVLDTATGRLRILGEHIRGAEVRQFTVRATDRAQPRPHTDEASFSVAVRPASRWRHPLHPNRHPKISGLDIKLRSKWRWSLGRFAHMTTWLGILALWVPIFGAIWIFVYAFTTPGTHGTYLGVGMLTAIAALVVGCLIGFLFGIPRVVSSGQARLGSSSEYAPSSNLSEVSDWLTKLLLGAGLVQLTHLGAPIGSLINHIAAALHTSAAYAGAAKVTAGTILFGYVAIGLLDGYVVTTMWYQKRLAQRGGGAN